MATPQGAIEIGNCIYLFRSQTNKVDCLISAHGGYIKENRPCPVPPGVKLFFYAPHGHVLSDPGLNLMHQTRGLEVVETWDRNTPEVQRIDYILSKYQNSEKQGFGRDMFKKIDKDYGKHNKGTENYSAIFAEISREDRKVTTKQAIINNPQSSNTAKRGAQEQLDKWIVAMNVLTIRNRMFRADLRLSYVIKKAVEVVPTLKNFHCSFCRSLVGGDDPTYEVKFAQQR